MYVEAPGRIPVTCLGNDSFKHTEAANSCSNNSDGHRLRVLMGVRVRCGIQMQHCLSLAVPDRNCIVRSANAVAQEE